MSPIDEGFSSRPKVTTVVGVDGVGLEGEFGLGAEQVFFEEEGSIAIDSNTRLRYLSRIRLSSWRSSPFLPFPHK